MSRFKDEMNGVDVDPKMVTNQVLKLCNVFREKQDIYGPSNFMRKRTGTGGCGGRRLSPEHQAKLGSFGFKPRHEQVRRSDGCVITKRPPYQESSKAEMIYKLN